MKKTVFILLCIALFSGTSASDVLSEQWVEASEVSSGTCGENCTWILNEEGTLTISGTGTITGNLYPLKNTYAEHKNDISRIVIGEGITDIGDCAFGNLGNVTEVVLPDTLKTIGYRAFASQWQLHEVEIPSSVTAIYGEAFEGCTSLQKVTLHEGLKLIGEKCFYDADALKELSIPESTDIIGEWAFGFYTLSDSIIGGGVAADEMIYGCQGSTAEKYAFDCGINFDALDPVVSGDVNGDGNVDGFDNAILKRYLNSKDDFLICLSSSDTNEDMKVDENDARLLQDYLLKRIDTFSVK